jgi:hypothetical protein
LEPVKITKGFWMAHHERESLAGGPWHHENGEQQNVGEQNGECLRGFVEVEQKAKLVGKYLTAVCRHTPQEQQIQQMAVEEFQQVFAGMHHLGIFELHPSGLW